MVTWLAGWLQAGAAGVDALCALLDSWLLEAGRAATLSIIGEGAGRGGIMLDNQTLARALTARVRGARACHGLPWALGRGLACARPHAAATAGAYDQCMGWCRVV